MKSKKCDSQDSFPVNRVFVLPIGHTTFLCYHKEVQFNDDSIAFLIIYCIE